jgi:hypothetical protein
MKPDAQRVARRSDARAAPRTKVTKRLGPTSKERPATARTDEHQRRRQAQEVFGGKATVSMFRDDQAVAGHLGNRLALIFGKPGRRGWPGGRSGCGSRGPGSARRDPIRPCPDGASFPPTAICRRRRPETSAVHPCHIRSRISVGEKPCLKPRACRCC